MYVTIIVVSSVLSIFENGIQCFTIRNRINDINNIKNFTHSTANVTIQKIIGKPISKNENEILPINKTDNDDNEIFISDKKNDRLESKKLGQRRAKFIGPLAFLANPSLGGLTNVVPGSANVFAKLPNRAISLYFTLPGYFAGLYNQQPFFPYSYPVLQYPVTAAIVNNKPQNFVNEIQTTTTTFPLTTSLSKPNEEKILNSTVNKVEPKINATVSANGNDQLEIQTLNGEVETNREPAATEIDSKRIVLSNEKIDPVGNIDLPVVGEGTESRGLFGFGETTTTTEATTTTTTAVPNVTVSTTVPVENTTGSLPFYGYYGGLPQDVGHVILTTEDPQQRYLKDYTEDIFPLPFERPAIFNPYQNVESYSSPFVNSFSPAERFPEFLNTIESDRYIYDTENRRNLNGFRPILK